MAIRLKIAYITSDYYLIHQIKWLEQSDWLQ